jgi:hypothetical protein
MSYFPSRWPASILACLYVLVLPGVVVKTAAADQEKLSQRGNDLQLPRSLWFDPDELLNSPPDKLLMAAQLHVEANIRTLQKATAEAIRINKQIEKTLPPKSFSLSLGKELCGRGGPTDDYLVFADMIDDVVLRYKSAYKLFKEKSDALAAGGSARAYQKSFVKTQIALLLEREALEKERLALQWALTACGLAVEDAYKSGSKDGRLPEDFQKTGKEILRLGEEAQESATKMIDDLIRF